MDGALWSVILAVLGVVVPSAAALYEFVFVGRKRLGYRVQMDTTATDQVHSPYAGALQQLQHRDGTPLVDPSFVLLRIENNGATHIDTSDYAVLDDDRVGIRVRFPGRRVTGTVVTELSDDFLRHSLGEESGLRVMDGIIELPKVPLNRTAHYKVLVALERLLGEADDFQDEFPPPMVVGGIKGGVGSGRIRETKGNTGTPRWAVPMICFLVAVVLAQFTVSLGDDAAPLDCAKGELALVGSTAFAPVLREAAAAYGDTCPGAAFTIRTRGSLEGLRELDRTGREKGPERVGLLAFSDGTKGERYPRLLPRPVAFSLFTLVVNEKAGVQDLSLRQIRRLYSGEVLNWSEVGGEDVPVRLVDRYSDSGTRKAFERRVLGGVRQPGDTSDDCLEPAPGARGGVVRCARGSTEEVLEVVARTPGAIGYSAAGTAADRGDLLPVRINGRPATLESADHGVYPFWGTEYAYTYGDPPADSLAAGFLRYLTSGVGRDIVRSHGHRPCAELRNPVLCRPS